MSVRVMLVDDHQIVLDGLAALLEPVTDIEVVARVRDGRTAVETARSLKPDLVVMDLSMAELSGIEASRQILAEQPGTRILVLSMHRERQYLTAALEAGAQGYLLKDRAGEFLIDAVRRVSVGGRYICPEMTAIALGAFQDHLRRPREPAGGELTGREREVLQLIAEGHTGRQIAARLGISERTVAAHRQHIADKLDLRDTASLVKYAIRHGLTTADR